MKPLVSVLTPSYNYGRFIQDCLDSVAAQRGVTVEHVVADGDSRDDTKDRLRASRALWTSEPDGGQSEALNRALRRAKGEWIAWLNADEYYLPDALSRLVAAALPGTAVVHGDAVHVDVEGRPVRLVSHHRFSALVLAHYGCYIPTCASLLHRDVLDGGFDESLKVVMDWDVFLRASACGEVRYLPQALAAFRLHADQVTAKRTSPFQSPEHQQVRARHGLPTSRPIWQTQRLLARGTRALLKAKDGAYRREAAYVG